MFSEAELDPNHTSELKRSNRFPCPDYQLGHPAGRPVRLRCRESDRHIVTERRARRGGSSDHVSNDASREGVKEHPVNRPPASSEGIVEPGTRFARNTLTSLIGGVFTPAMSFASGPILAHALAVGGRGELLSHRFHLLNRRFQTLAGEGVIE